MNNNNEYKTCPDCCYDILDDEGDVMDHECISDNEMIAEFMGLERTSDATNAMYHNKGEFIGRNLEYHTSWDWLMPVAKKCINPEDNTEGWDNLAVALTTCNIEEVYQAVVEFIKTYNDGR
jgi:hypothetical protein